MFKVKNKDNKIKMQRDSVSFFFDMAKGTFSFCLQGFALNGCATAQKAVVKSYAQPKDYKLAWRVRDFSGDSAVFSCRNALGSWELNVCFTDDAGAPGIRIDMSGNLRAPLRSLEMIPLFMKSLRADHVLVHGRKMGGCDSIPLPVKEEKSWKSSFQNMITRDGVTLQIAHPLSQAHPSVVTGRVTNRMVRDLTVSSLAEFIQPGPVSAESVTLRAARDGHALMTAWGDREKTSGTSIASQKHGWNSWDYYRWTITEDEVMANAEFIRSDPVLSRHVKRIIVDDGWQYCYGEWDANPLFPSGMAGLAKKITQMGFEPGLWFAPCVIEPHARIAQWDTDMLALGESGYPCLSYACMKRLGFVLDPTVEKSREWLRSLFKRYTGMGYKYFKLDFLWQMLKAPRFHDESVPKGYLMKMLVGPIREVTRGKAEILGCNYNFEGGSDLVDVVRVSGDVHPTWSHITRNVLSVAARFWSNNRLWINDPDFALCRSKDTSHDPDLNRLLPSLVDVTEDMPVEMARKKAGGLCSISIVEAQTLMGLVVISGNAVNLSDKLPLLNEAGLDIARRTVAAPVGETGVPLDLFSSRLASCWMQTVGKRKRVMLVNWSDAKKEISLDFTPHSVNASRAVNFWTDAVIKIKDNRLRVVLAPHESLLADITHQ